MVLARLVYYFFFFNLVLASSVLADTSANLIDPTKWDGATYAVDPNDCCSNPAGSGAIYDTNSNVIKFSYGLDTVSQTIAINEALKQSGIQVDGYQYHWHYKLVSNNGTGNDTLVYTVTLKDANGNEVEQYTYNYGASAYDVDIHQAGTQLFTRGYLDPQSIQLKIQGKDGGYWAGLYGPELTYTDLRLIYSANPCATNPLYDPSCPGYAEAYAELLFNQQCNANPLSNPACPGYEAAYFTQQCSANPLYSSGCPGYAEAYYDQQCSLNPLYDSGCSGYAEAYLTHQCTANPRYSPSCQNYNDTLATGNLVDAYGQAFAINQALGYGNTGVQVHSANIGFDYDLGEKYCSGSWSLGECTEWSESKVRMQWNVTKGNEILFYDDKTISGINTTGTYRNEILIGKDITEIERTSMTLGTTGNAITSNPYIGFTFTADGACTENPLVNPQCPGYQDAYYNQQCSLNPLYDSGCPGYQTAYYNNQCSISPLYDQNCPGYAEAYYDQQCSLNPLYDSGCTGYGDAYFAQQCGNDPFYDNQCPGYADAYYDQQCSISPLYDEGCTGYTEAYYDQQCSINPLYDSGCPGYETAYYNQQCSLNPLYDTGCQGYDDAYYSYQCTYNPLYDSGCPGYEEAYYEKYIKPSLEQTVAEATTSETTTVTTSDPVAALTDVASATGDATVDNILKTTVEPVVVGVETVLAEPVTTTAEVAAVEPEAKVDEVADVVAEVEESESTSKEEPKDEKSSGKTEKQKADAKRDRVKKLVAERASQLADKMANAASMEAQRDAQNYVMALIGYNPDFTTYSAKLPDAPFYNDPGMQDKKLPTNPGPLRNGLAQQILHEKMVEMQWENKK